MEYLPWLLTAAFAVLSAVMVYFFVTEKKQRKNENEEHRQTVLKLEDEKHGVENERDTAIAEGERKDRLIDLVEKTILSSDGKVKIFGFEKANGDQLLGCEDEELRGASETLSAALDQSLGRGELDGTEARYAVNSESDEESSVYVLNDVSDRYRIMDLNGEIEGLNGEIEGLNGEIEGLNGEIGGLHGEIEELNRQVGLLEGQVEGLKADKASLGGEIDSLKNRIERSDLLTDVMNIEYFCENINKLAGDSGAWLVFIKTEADLPQTASFGKSRETYIKSFVKRMLDTFGSLPIARYREDSFCCIFSKATIEKVTQNAEKILAILSEESKLLSFCDDHCESRSVVEITSLSTGNIRDLVLGLSVKAAHDRFEKRYGIQSFAENDLVAILGYKQGMEKIIRDKSVRFTYRPVAYSADAKVFAYQAEPYFPGTTFNNIAEAVEGTRLFGYTGEFERIMYDECMRRVKHCVGEGQMLYNTHVILSSTPGSCMTGKDADAFYEKHYADAKNIITEIPERIPGELDYARLKKKRAAAWGASCMMDCGADIPENTLKIGLLSPDIVRIDAAVACGENGGTITAEIRKQIDLYGGKLMIDGIESSAQLKAAMAAGAEFLAGKYVGTAAREPQDISDKCIKEIGYKRFGKRGKS